MKKRILLKLIALALIPILLAAFAYGMRLKDKGFAIHKICTHLDYEQDWDVRPLRVEKKQSLKHILSQKYTYLADGKQAYAFVSQDGKYVIKFFKAKHLLPKMWLTYLPLPAALEDYRQRKVDKRILKRYETFTSYKIAFEDFHKESGLVFVHLNSSRDIKKKVLLVDAKGKEYKVDLDRTPFVIQRRAELLYVKLAKIREKVDHAEMREAIHAFLQLVEGRCKNGFADKDKGISNNYGFDGDTVIQIDVGEMVYDEVLKEPSNVQREVHRVAKKLEFWIMRHAPEYMQDLHDEFQRYFE